MIIDEEEIEQILATVDNTTFGMFLSLRSMLLLMLINNCVDMSDWNVVITECSSLAAEWELLSAYLGISAKMIDIIKRDNPNKSSACWNEALKQWIMQSYETEKFDNPSWRTLLKAIAKLDKLLFKKLAGKYQSEPFINSYIITIHVNFIVLIYIIGQPKPNKSEKDGESGTQRSRISDSKQGNAIDFTQQ